MTRGWRFALTGVAVLGAAAVAGVAWFVAEPLTALSWTRRATLERGGFERRELATSAGKLTAFEAGAGSTLLLLHGVGDNAGSWAAVAPQLSRHYRVVALDLPGHGDSAPGEGPLRMAAVVEGAEAGLTFAGPEPVTVIGNSLGAWLATVLAARHPEQVERLILVGGGPLAGEAAPSLQPTNRAEAAALMARVRDPGAAKLPGYVLDDLVERSGKGPVARLTADLPGLIAHLMREEDVAALATPVDLLWGASDGIMPPAYGRRMLALLPRARFSELPKCGHIPQIECPQLFLDQLLPLLETLPDLGPLPEPVTVAEPSAVTTP